MKLNIHQAAAVVWLLCFTPSFLQMVSQSHRHDAGAVMAYGFVAMIATIAVVPLLLLRIPAFKRWFCWTDALSLRQWQALAQRDLGRYYQISWDDGYEARITPYTWRLLALIAPAIVVELLVPLDKVNPALAGILAFPPLYVLGVLCLIVLSSPIGHSFKRRFQRRKP